MPGEQPANLLIDEKSPYLQQHAHNPVDWFPWGDDAFTAAREGNKPIFLSIGYATCHWCHVMAHESFEDAEIARYLNEHFVSIKVDREERPDIDAIYMDVCQAFTGRGGWPLTVFMDAEMRPFFAGTYFPPKTQGGRIGFGDLLERIVAAWNNDRESVLESAKSVVASLEGAAKESFFGDVPEDVFTIIANHHVQMFDEEHGGFGQAPKFPSTHHLLLLFRLSKTLNNPNLARLATHTLDAMRRGGMYDHVGFGFHRYSTDREWRLPHFEKMLYDQAMAMIAYTEAWQLTGNNTYKLVVEELSTFLGREMTSSEGAFYSAQDADSEGEEGKFYVWSYEEIQQHCTIEELELLASHFGVSKEGNFFDEATGELVPANIIMQSTRLSHLNHLSVSEADLWQSLREKLYSIRKTRIAPITDDKILTDWNGLMIAALAKAARALSSQSHLKMAQRAYDAVVKLCGGSSWVHRYKDGDRLHHAMLSDYAAMGWAATELYQTTGERRYLDDAKERAVTISDLFTLEDGSLAATISNHRLLIRSKEGYDSAYPSGNSLAAVFLAHLGAITGEELYTIRARMAVQTYALQMTKYAPGFCMLLCAWEFLAAETSEVVFVGNWDDAFLQSARQHIASSFLPNVVFVHERNKLTQSAPVPSVLVCTGRTCKVPFTTMSKVNEFLVEEAAR